MKMRYILILALVLLASGCIENPTGRNVPVVYANVTLSGDPNGTILINGIEASAGEMPEFNAPLEQIPKKLPAIYVSVVQNMMPITFQAGREYSGPGVYNLTVGFENPVNRSVPMVITVMVYNRTEDMVNINYLPFNWSTESQSKTFK